MRQKTSTTRLPQVLKDEIDASTTDSKHYRPKNASKTKRSRKEVRKLERLDRKQHKAAYFSNASHKKRPAQEELAETPKSKRLKYNTSILPTPTNTTKAPSTTPAKSSATALSGLHKASTEKGNHQVPYKTVVPIIQNRKEEEEDAYIAYLEAKLGHAKGGKKKREEDDGLDDLLDFTDSITASTLQHEQKIVVLSDEERDYDDGDKTENTEEDTTRKQLSHGETEGSVSTDEEDQEWQGIDEDHLAVGFEFVPDQPVPIEGEVTTRYIPPNSKMEGSITKQEPESLVKLSRQLKGLLNRMSEQNILVILDSIEGVYREHRRNDVTSTLTTLIVDIIASHSTLLDSYVVLYAAFVSSLHKVIGVEFGRIAEVRDVATKSDPYVLAAHFTQSVVLSYERHFALYNQKPTSELQEQAIEHGGKECSNLIALLSELYNFQVISSLLIFDIIRGLLNTGLDEFCVELLLKVVRSSGQQLRQDDPSLLKDIIQIIQTNVSDRTQSLSSRTRFMIETLTNLKNNRLKKNLTQNQGLESVERMKKVLTGLGKKRHIVAHEPLRVSLEDLHNSDTKGKWWLVGAAWGGNPLVDRQVQPNAVKTVEPAGSAGKLDALARKQGMNSDIRRSIFVVLMSSDDYVDACERLSQLKLKEVQQREILRVLLHCCGNERSYNPYYTLVCQHLCRLSHSHRVTLQFCLWDFLRDLGETSVGGLEIMRNLGDKNDASSMGGVSNIKMRNLAKAYGWWIAKDCVALTVLKPINFMSLKPTTVAFLREMLIEVLICSQRTTPIIVPATKDAPIERNRQPVEAIFLKATKIQTLATGLLYFLSEALRGSAEDNRHGAATLIEWACDVAKDTLRTNVE